MILYEKRTQATGISKRRQGSKASKAEHLPTCTGKKEQELVAKGWAVCPTCQRELEIGITD